MSWVKRWSRVEYAGLVGGAQFEPKESNPMMGRRGASRYYTDYADGFALECMAIRKVCEEMGLSNLKLMIPRDDLRSA